MCGILGIVAPAGRSPSVDDRRLETMRDLMAHRGPDGRGQWRCENIAFAHRRLAVLDTSPSGHQPMVSPDGRAGIVYNGELYNDAELRAGLGAEGVEFRSRSDAETALAMLRAHGERAIPRLRGMYAMAFVDLDAGTLLLARDPLGIKPLYYAFADTPGGSELVFASEIPAILAHPAISARPDFVTISAYLTTIRTTLGPRTLFAGIHTLQPGEVARIDLKRGRLVVSLRSRWQGSREPTAEDPCPREPGIGRHGAPTDAELRAAVEDSIARHLRADVPTCCLLSGGLDSTIITAHAARLAPRGALRTYASGAADSVEPGDPEVAGAVAEKLGAVHAEAPVARHRFAERWTEMIAATGLPLSTPNEVAINALAARLRADGQVVALSGEGADELFGGYEIPLTRAAEHLAALDSSSPGEWRRQGGLFQVEAAAWIAPSAKGSILTDEALRRSERDEHLREHYRATFERIAAEDDGPSPLETHLRFCREVNLTGLLLRLDQATMLEGVEGRTPFADQRLAAMAGRLPMSRKFEPARGGAPGERLIPARTKISLRAAFGADLPSSVLARPKASFPLPFQAWLEDSARAVLEGCLARELFTESTLAAVAHSPRRFWPVAWPVINIAMWGKRWWD